MVPSISLINMQKKVSIITSCFNRQNTIDGCIQSVLRQNYNNIEYIIVDGASKDNTLGVINKYKDKLAAVISEPDNGMYEGINKGFKIATGDIIGLVHSDDFLFDNNVINAVVDCFNSNNYDIVYGNGIYVDNENINCIRRDWISGAYSKNKIKRGWLPLHPTIYISKVWLEECGLYDESYKIAADTDWLLHSFYDLSPKVFYLKKYIVRMRMGGLSTSSKNSKNKWEEDLRIYKAHGIQPQIALTGKIISKIPQFIRAMFISLDNIPSVGVNKPKRGGVIVKVPFRHAAQSSQERRAA